MPGMEQGGGGGEHMIVYGEAPRCGPHPYRLSDTIFLTEKKSHLFISDGRINDVPFTYLQEDYCISFLTFSLHYPLQILK